MCDTNDQQARFALNRLNKKVEIWNLENDKPSIMLRQQMSICQPGEDLWEKLRAMKQSMENETAAWSGPAYIATEIATDLSEPLGY
jgi:hypothetical protein